MIVLKKYAIVVVVGLLSIGIFFLQFQYQKTYQPHTYYQVYLDEDVIGVIESPEELATYISKQGDLIRNQVIEYQEQLDVLEGIDNIFKSKVSSSKQYLNMEKKYDQLFELIDEEGTFDPKNREKVETLVLSFGMDLENSYISNDKIENYDTFLKNLEAFFRENKKKVIEYLDQNRKKLSLTESEAYQLDTYFSKKYDKISYPKQKYMSSYVTTNAPYLYAENIYEPIGINIEKINTYHADLMPVEDVYAMIVAKKPCTIEGYRFRIKKTEENDVSKYVFVGASLLDHESFQEQDESEDDVIIYVTDESVFREAVEELEVVFVGSETYEKYKKGTQEEIKTTGSRIDDIYVDEPITIKEQNISVGEKIYNDPEELSSFLLYGENKNEKIVYAKATDTILSLTYDQGISVEEFFLSNPSFTSVNNILYENQPVVIAEIDPQLSIVVERFVVEDMEIEYETVEEEDPHLNEGMRELKQKGANGISRVSQNVKSVNGSDTFVDPISNTTLKTAKNEIISVGTKIIPYVGSLSSWYWPTKSGYRLTSYYGSRKNPFGSGREFHTGLDIAGTGYGSPVYASNNGTIYYMGTQSWGYGIHMIIDHHNGYYTLYGHMSGYAKGMKEGLTVARGQIIGYVGSTGAATGPHLHFEVRTCPKFSCVTNPLPYLRKKK